MMLINMIGAQAAASEQHQRRRTTGSLKWAQRDQNQQQGHEPSALLSLANDQQQQQQQQRRQRLERADSTECDSATNSHNKNSISSNETVIVRPLEPKAEAQLGPDRETHTETGKSSAQQDEPPIAKKSRTTLKSLLIGFAGHHFGLFHASGKTKSGSSQVSIEAEPCLATNGATSKTEPDEPGAKCNSNALLAFAHKYLNLNFGSTGCHQEEQQRNCHSCPVTPVKQRQQQSGCDGQLGGKLANGSSSTNLGPLRSGSLDGQDERAATKSSEKVAATVANKPSVRFSESAQTTGECGAGRRFLGRRCAKQQVKFADCGVQTSAGPDSHALDSSGGQQVSLAGGGSLLAGPFIEDDAQRARLVEQLFKMQPDLSSTGSQGLEHPDSAHPTDREGAPAEVGMNSSQFRENGYKLIDYICNYLDTIRERRVTPINIEPGYLKSLIQPAPPAQGEPFSAIMRDFEQHIMCGITHWQHPHFHAYFPAGNAYPSILADMLSDALGCVGFSWAASPAYTELEIIMLDWMGKMIGLPDEFLCLSGSGSSGHTAPSGSCLSGLAGGGSGGEQQGSRGGGVIQGSASECVLVNLLAARHWAMEKLRKKYPGTPDGMLLSKLIGYCSKEAHSCVEKAAMIGFIRMRALDTDQNHSLRGDTLRRAMEADLEAGLEPFIVCATLGTTSCVSFDNLRELGEVCRAHDDLWLHVDAAYAGSALICPEFKYLMDGVELATSFNMNPNKWLLINFDCSLMWVKDRFKLTRAFVVDPLYLQHSFSDQAIDYRHWGIPLSRRFRALKLWFVIRNYGLEGLREYIRKHVRLAKLFAQLISEDKRFTITNQVTLGLVCFRLAGSNALNQRLLSMINASGKLHMVPASLNGRYIIRFCVCDQNAQERDIHYAYECISATASELFELIRAGKERIRAISQQNTIDVSNISLHTQQSASADRLSGQEAAGQECGAAPPGARRHVLRRSSRHNDEPATANGLDAADASQAEQRRAGSQESGTRTPLTKQLGAEQDEPLSNGHKTAHTNQVGRQDDESDELDLDDMDDDEVGDFLDLVADEADENDEEELAAGEPSRKAQELQEMAAAAKQLGEQLRSELMSDSISPIQRGRLSRASGKSSHSYSRGATTAGAQSGWLAGAPADEDDEAADELVKLIDKRNRMSLRYKREFFVRVVSDPRVYRASISGDINAHASTASLGSSSSQLGAGAAASETGASKTHIETKKSPADR